MESEWKKRAKSFPKIMFMRNIILPLVYVAKRYSYFPNTYTKCAKFDIHHDPFDPNQVNSMESAVLKYIHCLEISECSMMKTVNLDHMWVENSF